VAAGLLVLGCIRMGADEGLEKVSVSSTPTERALLGTGMGSESATAPEGTERCLEAGECGWMWTSAALRVSFAILCWCRDRGERGG
jgi:hypothetical protein